MPQKQYLYDEIEIPLFITQAKIPFEEKKQQEGFKQLCLDLPRMNMTFMRRPLNPSKDLKTQKDLLTCLDRRLTKAGRKLLCKVHDQTEVGIQRFYLHHMSVNENFGLMTPLFFVNYSYSTLNQTLKLEVISKELKGVSFEKPDGEKYIAEKKAYVRTITKYKIQDKQIKTSRKFFTNSGVISSGLINAFWEFIQSGNIKITDTRNRYFITFCCWHQIHLLKLENQRILTASFVLFQKDRNQLIENRKKIACYEKMINEMTKEDVVFVMENIFIDRNYIRNTIYRL